MNIRNLLITALVITCAAGAAQKKLDWFEWTQLPSMQAAGGSEQLGVAGAFTGVHNDALIIAGGANFPDSSPTSQKRWTDEICVLTKDGSGYKWYPGGRLDKPAGYGASVSTSRGVVCIGGQDAQGCFADVFLLKWDAASKKIEKTALPSLPGALSNMSAACIGDVVYVAGGQKGLGLETASRDFLRIDLSKSGDELKWQRLMAWPAEARAFNITAAQHNGSEYCIYVIGGRSLSAQGQRINFADIYEFSPSKYDGQAYDAKTGVYSGKGTKQSPWRKYADMPCDVQAVGAVDVGQSHILIFGAGYGDDAVIDNYAQANPSAFGRNVLAYHTITSTVVPVGKMPLSQVTTQAVKWGDKIVLPSGEIAPRVRTPQIWQAQMKKSDNSFGTLNFTTLTIYLAAVTLVGVYFSKRNKTTDDFFRGGKRIPAWAAGLSIFATLLSSITFMAIPAKVYSTDWTFLVINLMGLAIMPFIWIWILPFYMKTDATSAYEFLEKRFNIFVRLFAAISFVVYQVGRMAIVIFLPSLALATITDLTVSQSIIIMGVLSIIYCTFGGFEAVIWTDCLQSIVLLGGGLLSLIIVLVSTDGGIGGFVSLANADMKFRCINWDWSQTSIMTSAFWVMVVGGIGQSLVPNVSDQAIVQRYLSVSDVKAARSSIITSNGVGLLATFIFFAIGTALYVFYKNNPQGLDPAYPNDAIFPLFIANQIPAGLAGIVVAGIYAAAQSTISTSMNSISTVVVTDCCRRFDMFNSEKAYLNLARAVTMLSGVFGVGLALLFASSDIKSIWESFMQVLGLLGGPMCGLFILGIFTKRVGGIAAVLGALAGAAALYLLAKFTAVSFLLYASIGIVVCVLAGYILSFVIPEKKAQA